MKAKRRHELKENVLAQELEKLKVFLGKYGGWIAGAVVAAMIVLLIVWQLRAREHRVLDRERTQHRKLTSGSGMKRDDRLAGYLQLAETAKDPIIAADCRIRAAHMYSQDYLDVLGVPSASGRAEQSRQRAEELYRTVIARHSDRRQIVTNAYYGLGILAMNSEEKEKARQWFKQAAAGGANHPAAIDAKKRLDKLEEWFQSVKYPKTRPATQPAAASSPASGPAPAP